MTGEATDENDDGFLNLIRRFCCWSGTGKLSLEHRDELGQSCGPMKVDDCGAAAKHSSSDVRVSISKGLVLNQELEERLDVLGSEGGCQELECTRNSNACWPWVRATDA